MISSSLRAALMAGGLSASMLGATPVFAADLPIIVNGSEAQQLVASGAKIVDVRSAAAYAKGHLPGAVNVPWQALNQSEVDGVRNEFADDATFEKVFSAAGLAGVTPDKRVVLFTRGGFQLTHSFTVLNLLGYQKVDFFTGKFEGWDNGATKRI